MSKRMLLKLAAALALTSALGAAQAQNTPIKFQLDWRFEGPAALFLSPAAKGYFKDAKLDVTIDAGNGSGGTVTRVASGAYDMGFADLAALMEFHANNPDAPNKPVAVMMVYNNTPASVMVLEWCDRATKIGLSGIALPEIISAFCRLHREARITDTQYRQLKSLLLADIEDAALCDLTPAVLAHAISSLETNVLRGMDAIHIGSALALQADVFVSADTRQLDAAARAGLRVEAV